MHNKNHINQLFNRLLDNSISEIELEQLLGMLNQPESEGQVKALMAEHWEAVKEIIGPVVMDSGTQKRFSDILIKAGSGEESRSQKTKVITRVFSNQVRWIGIAASMLILVSAGLYWYFGNGFVSAPEIEPVEQLATTEYSGKQVVHLPDGSTVILNEGSQLKLTGTFGQENREVKFSGEGYFDIAHDPDRPFKVHTGSVTTTVLGTAFNLIAYEDQSQIKVAVERGEVAVGDDKRVYDRIHPKEQLVVNKSTRKYEKEVVDLSAILAWKEKFLILTGTTIEQAAEMIGDRYHIQVSIANEDMKNCTINAAFMHGESLEQVLRVICGVLQAQYTINDNKVEIIGGRKCI